MSDRFGSIAINSDKTSPPPEKRKKSVRRKVSPPPRKAKGRGTIVTFLLIAVLLLSSYFWTGLYLAPLLIKKYLPRYVFKTTGLELSLDNVRLNPLNFQVVLEDIQATLPDTAPEKPLLQIHSLLADLHLISLLRTDVVCDRLAIQELELNIIREQDKGYNFPPMGFTGEQKQGEIINFAALPFLFSLNNIDISDSRIFFEDRVTGSSHKVEDLQLAIPTLSNFSFQSDNYIQPHFSAVINNSEVELSGEAVQLAGKEGFQTSLSCSIQALDLVPYFSYLPVTFPFQLTQGMADTDIDIGFSPKRKEGSRLTLDIRMSGTDIKMQGKNSDLQVSIAKLETNSTVSPLTKRLHIKSLLTKGSQLTGNRQAVAETLQQFLSYSQNKYTHKTVISIDQLLAEDGGISLYPHGKKEKGGKPSDWTALQLSIRNYHPQHSTGSMHLSGQQKGGDGNFTWQAGLSQSGTLQGKLQLQDFPASSFFALLSPPPEIGIQGSASFSGDLTLSPSRTDKPAYSIKNGMLQLHKLQLSQGKTEWLTAESVRITRLNRIEGHSRLGNIFLKGASLKLNNRKISPFFSRLLQQRSRPRIGDIDYSGSLFLESGTDRQESLKLDNVHWQLKGLDQTPEAENFSFTGHLGEGGLIKARGTMNLIPPTLQANIDFSKVASSQLSLLFPNWPTFRDNPIILHGKGIYRFPESIFSGNMQLAGSSLQNSDGKGIFSWKQAELKGLRYSFSPPSLQAETMLLDSPQFTWQRSKTPPIQEVQKGVRKFFTLDAKGKPSFPLDIKKITFQNGTVTLKDPRLSPPWQTTVDSIHGGINNFNSDAAGLSPFTINGVMEGATMSLSGSISLFKHAPGTRARLKLKEFPLAAIAKQLSATPVNGDEASLHLQMDLVRNNSHESGNAELTVNNLSPDPASPDLALALALLKNRENSFSMRVETDGGGRSFFQKALGNFQTKIIKASYTPFLLDTRFSDLQDRDFIPFHAGTSTISAAGKETLIRYAKLLAEHPSLSVAVSGMVDANTDREVLLKALEAKEQQRVDEENRKKEKEFYAKQVHPPTKQTDNSPKDTTIVIEELKEYTPLLPNPVQVSDEELLDLARERTLTTYDFCVNSLGIAAERIELAEKGEIDGDSPTNGVRLRLTPFPSVPSVVGE